MGRCIDLNCYKNAVFNKPETKIGIYCARHKLPEMVNVLYKSCIEPDCIKQPKYNTIGNKKGIYCARHKLPEMVNVLYKSCIEFNCDKNPKYNTIGTTIGIYCARHKLPGMVDVQNKKCLELNCDKNPNYNKPGTKRGIYCALHKIPGMVNVISKKCKNPNCETRPIEKLEYCSPCLRYFEPFHPRIKNIKQREVYLTKKIISHFPDLDWKTDKIINCQECNNTSKRRPDLFLDVAHYTLIIEIDEDQHKNYLCENKRSMEIFQSLGNRPIIFIRFNPDTFIKDDKKYPGCFLFSNTGIIRENKNIFKNRFKTLSETIDKYLLCIPTKEITNEYLFYNLVK